MAAESEVLVDMALSIKQRVQTSSWLHAWLFLRDIPFSMSITHQKYATVMKKLFHHFPLENSKCLNIWPMAIRTAPSQNFYTSALKQYRHTRIVFIKKSV